ncbi:hypothetical protein TPHA_0E03970 [Tetrapisispora phaffii CBS 4417]|uniref:Peptidase M3A/M3B catalytic domain-containing protein n=1 Tax=Tetrapisispora phaffii (strain ATCC 24235 / CBS 4417 / NBRC 1672 / NRRL Y-8282 / UCD 70-5) TaxID=1071381 RepID=G8BUA8_TETPH|nr:hypothetical protein TPHA_0E03970 [Tetrapisispora phaffii CBS 4417]CCE63486.1 hypothetical protein TPHA_0E03970 [Tetrapisispora phaffii CBS 4417]
MIQFLSPIIKSGIGKSFKNKSILLSLVAIPAVAIGIYHQNNQGLRFYTASQVKMNEAAFIAPQLSPKWDFSPERILSDAKKIIDTSNDFYNAMVAIENPSIENFVIPSINFENENSLAINQLTFLQHVSKDKLIRDASLEATELITNFDIEISLRYDMFKQFDKIFNDLKDNKKYNDLKTATPKDYEIFKYVEKCHKDYVRSGLNLSEEKRNEIKEIKKRIALNSLQFSKNLGEQNEFVAFTKEELEGVSDDVMKQFETYTDEQTGEQKFKVTFKYPDIFPVLKTAKNPNTRKIAFNADQNKVPENEKLFIDTLKLRYQLGKILGYDTYANYNLDIKMAKNQETVMEFLVDLKDKLKPLAEKEIEVLKAIKKTEAQELNMAYDDHYYIWDHRYYDNKYLKDKFNVDLEKISEYYPVESTIQGMLKIYETVMNLKFIEETDKDLKSTWAGDDVKQLAVWKMDDPSKPEFVGWIYFDLHPREGKYGHAANFGMAPSYIDKDSKRIYPVTALVCNFSAATADKPALLKHNEITTFFHELGHGIHDLVGNNGIGRFNGPGAVPWDFVEAPSQMLEFWTWNKNELLSLSKHYKTGEKIPESLLESLIATKHVNGALFALRQLHFGLFDMKVHTTTDDNQIDNMDLVQLWNGLREEISLVENGDEMNKGYDSFGHIMSDSYSAGYYGYMWAEVFATDMYYSKFAKDPLNTKSGIEYRDIILARGGIRETNDNLKEFLGREPSKEAFLKELGLQ